MTALCVLLGAGAATFGVLFVQYRRRLRDVLGRDVATPIPTVSLDDFDPVFEQTPLGSSLASEVVFVGRVGHVPGGTSDREAWILAALARRRQRFFEFGTATGKTAYLLARNSGPGARVTTLTLAPQDQPTYQRSTGDSDKATRLALAESAFTAFLYTGTDVEGKIEQLYGDSKEFDTTPYRGQCDLVFVDGSHAYSYVENDTRKALELVAPGGIILWHDYTPLRRGGRDVCRSLNAWRRKLPLVRLRETTLVAYRAPGI